jgi:hypothetical protein
MGSETAAHIRRRDKRVVMAPLAAHRGRAAVMAPLAARMDRDKDTDRAGQVRAQVRFLAVSRAGVLPLAARYPQRDMQEKDTAYPVVDRTGKDMALVADRRGRAVGKVDCRRILPSPPARLESGENRLVG